MSEIRCPGCRPGACPCRDAQLDLFGSDDERPVPLTDVGAHREYQKGVAAAVDPIAGVPDRGVDLDRAQVVAVNVDEAEGRHEWILRPVPPSRRTTMAWLLTGGPCAGEYDALSTWPPPDTIRAVVNSAGIKAVLDLDEDEPELDEEVTVYKLAGQGFMCGRGNPSGTFASYFPASFTEQERMAALRAGLEATA